MTQKGRQQAQRPILDVSIRYTRGALLEAQGQISAARDAFTSAAAIAHTSLEPGARNAGLADEKLAAFVARHPPAELRSRARPDGTSGGTRRR